MAKFIEIQKQKPPFGKCFLIFSCLLGTERWHHLKTPAMTEQYIRDLFNIGSLKKKCSFEQSPAKAKLSLPALL